MRYWDSSAIVPVLVLEPSTAKVRTWLDDDPHVVTWTMTRLEVIGAIERRVREAVLSNVNRQAVLHQAEAYFRSFDEVIDVLPVVKQAIVLLARHPLRAADAAQLAAAIVAAEGEPASLDFVCLDHNLAEAARREGFTVYGWNSPE